MLPNPFTFDRLIHLIVGWFFIDLLLYLFRRYEFNWEKYFYIYLFVSLGTWVPDWDLILGIGFHRSPLTHGIFPAILVAYLVKKYDFDPFISIGFALGLSSHLFWDTIFYGDVRLIPGGTLDRIYLVSSGSILLVFSLIYSRLCFKRELGLDKFLQEQRIKRNSRIKELKLKLSKEE